MTAGGLPADAFALVYATAGGPRILEGANAANLVQLLGVPFLSPRVTDTPYPALELALTDDGLLPLDVEGCRTRLAEVAHALIELTPWACALKEREEEAYLALDYPRLALTYLPAAPAGPAPMSADVYFQVQRVPGLDLVAIFGAHRAAAAQEVWVAYHRNIGATGTVTPDVLQVSADEARQLTEALQALILVREAEVRELLTGDPHVPSAAVVERVAAAMAEACTPGTDLYRYFRLVGRQANDYRFNQVLRALLGFLDTQG